MTDLSCKGRYWTVIIYPENLVDNWKLEIPRILQVPFCYIVHDKDLRKEKEEERKVHIHLLIAYS